MRMYKILARIILMLSVIDFALGAPVFVQKHEVQVSVLDAAKDGSTTFPLRRDPSDEWLANAPDQTNAPSTPRSFPGSGQEPRQQNLRSRTDSNGSPKQPNPAPPPIEVNANYPPSASASWPNIDLNVDYLPSPTLPPKDLNPIPPSASAGRPNIDQNADYLPSLILPPKDPNPNYPPSASAGRPNIDLNADYLPSPTLPPKDLNPDHPPSPPPAPGSTSSSPTSQAPTGEPDPVNPSSPHDDSHALDSALLSGSRPLGPTMGHNLDLSSFPQLDPPKFKSLSELIPIPTHDTQTPSPASSLQTTSSSDESYSSSSWAPSGTNSDSDSESMSSQSPQQHVSPPPNLPGSSQGQLSTGGSSPPTIGPTNNRPPLASPSNTGPSTELNPQPGAKRPRPEELESGDLGSISKIFKGKLKRRLPGSGVLNASQRDSKGKFNFRA